MTTSTKILAGTAVLLFLLVYPFEVTVAPEWNIKVVDENGKPLTGAYILEFANQWTLDTHYEQAICSDKNGEAHFPRQIVRASVLTRASKFILNFGPHSSFGPDLEMGAERLGYGDMANNVTTAEWSGGRSRVHSQFSLHKCPTGFTAYRCNFDYDYWLGINGESAKKIAACQSVQ